MVSRELKGLSMKLKKARFGPYCKSYGDQRSYFHLKGVRAAQKTSSNNFGHNVELFVICHCNYSVLSCRHIIGPRAHKVELGYEFCTSPA
jgi:hypothetical protein